MKTLLLTTCLLIAVTVIQAETDPMDSTLNQSLEQHKDTIMKCAKAEGLEAEDVYKLMDKVNSKPDSCVRACVLKEIGVMKDSKIDKEMANKSIGDMHIDQSRKDAMVKTSNECLESTKSETKECKLANAFLKCLYA